MFRLRSRRGSNTRRSNTQGVLERMTALHSADAQEPLGKTGICVSDFSDSTQGSDTQTPHSQAKVSGGACKEAADANGREEQPRPRAHRDAQLSPSQTSGLRGNDSGLRVTVMKKSLTLQTILSNQSSAFFSFSVPF